MEKIQICEDCKNESICKFTGDMLGVWKEVNPLNNALITGGKPIKIAVMCGGFSKKASRQDGMVFRKDADGGFYR